MKKTFLLILLAITYISSAQDKQFIENLKSKDSIEAIKFVEEIASIISPDYKYLKVKMIPEENQIRVRITKEDDDSYGITAFYNIMNKGKNEDLEIVGEKYYGLVMVLAPYLELAKVWRAKVDSNINDTLVTEKGYISYSFKNKDKKTIESISLKKAAIRDNKNKPLWKLSR